MNLTFIKLDINIMDDTKMKLIFKMPEGDKIFRVWIGLLCLGMKSGRPGVLEISDGIPFNDEMLATQFNIELNIIRLGLKTFKDLKMIEVWEDGTMYIMNFEKHQQLDAIENARRISRESSQRYRDKVKGLLGDGHVTVTSSLVTEQNKNKSKNKNITEKIPFETFWDAYNKKVGKKSKLIAKWDKLTLETQKRILGHIKLYKQAQPNKQYRKNPETYLNNESWKDEIINDDNKQFLINNSQSKDMFA